MLTFACGDLPPRGIPRSNNDYCAPSQHSMPKSGERQLYSCHLLGYWMPRYRQSYHCMARRQGVGLWVRLSLRCLLDDLDLLLCEVAQVELLWKTHLRLQQANSCRCSFGGTLWSISENESACSEWTGTRTICINTSSSQLISTFGRSTSPLSMTFPGPLINTSSSVFSILRESVLLLTVPPRWYRLERGSITIDSN